jgi:hypothetical protein
MSIAEELRAQAARLRKMAIEASDRGDFEGAKNLTDRAEQYIQRAREIEANKPEEPK